MAELNPRQSTSGEYDMRGRRATCRHCGHRITVRGQQIWKSIIHDASIRIVAADRDGAIVEQVGREDMVGGRWGMSYRDLLDGYRKER